MDIQEQQNGAPAAMPARCTLEQPCSVPFLSLALLSAPLLHPPTSHSRLPPSISFSPPCSFLQSPLSVSKTSPSLFRSSSILCLIRYRLLFRPSFIIAELLSLSLSFSLTPFSFSIGFIAPRVYPRRTNDCSQFSVLFFGSSSSGTYIALFSIEVPSLSRAGRPLSVTFLLHPSFGILHPMFSSRLPSFLFLLFIPDIVYLPSREIDPPFSLSRTGG